MRAVSADKEWVLKTYEECLKVAAGSRVRSGART
jgi:hypothetical protein